MPLPPPEGKTRRRLSRRAVSLIATLWLGLMVVVTILFLAGPPALQRYDDAHKTQISCVVKSAREATVSTRSAKGAGTNLPQVVFKTSNCGTLLLQSFENAQESQNIVYMVQGGSTYNFEIGEGSRKLSWLLKIFGASPTIYKIEGVSSRGK